MSAAKLRNHGLLVLKATMILALLSVAPAHAYSQLFDWSAEGWSPTGPGSTPRTYTNVGGRGVDVAVNISMNAPADRFISSTPQIDGGNGLRTQIQT